jgi:hypothetical protein
MYSHQGGVGRQVMAHGQWKPMCKSGTWDCQVDAHSGLLSSHEGVFWFTNDVRGLQEVIVPILSSRASLEVGTIYFSSESLCIRQQ